MSVLNPKSNTTIAFTDGACKGNPGPGGWGAFLILSNGQQIEYFGGDAHTTNNKMELMGAIMALEKSPHDQHLEIWTDSSYVKNGITLWIQGWKNKGWKTSGNKQVKNQELWQRLDALQANRDVSWHWVKGHAGHAGNEKADELANRGVLSSSEPTDALTNDSIANDNAINNPDEFKKKLDIPLNSSSNPINSNAAINSIEDDVDWIFDDPLGFNESSPEVAIEEDAVYMSNSNSHQPSVSISEPISSMSISNPEFSNTNEISPMLEAAEPQVSHQQTEEIKFDGDTSRANPHFKPLLPEPVNKGKTGRQLIMDTETTGLDALKGDRVIEVGIIELVNRKFTGEKLHVYINPERGMDDEVIRVHGITEAFLADKPKFKEVAKPLYEFMLGAEVIAHNAPFDMSFLSMEFDRVGLSDFAEKVTVTDSLVMAKQQYPGQKNTLDALVRRLNVGKMDRTFHGALLDSEILAEVYLAMTGGQVALAIDEDTQSEGEGSHADFSHLASQILKANTPLNNHVSWVSKLLKKYPNLAETQGVGCFYKIDDTPEAAHLLYQKSITNTQSLGTTVSIAPNLANNLFIAS